MRSILARRLGTAVATLTLCGCFAVVDVDRFHTSTSQKLGPDASAVNAAGTYLNLKLSLVGMSPHVTQLFEYRILDSTNFVQSRGIVNPLGAVDVVINVPNAVPTTNGPFHLDFYADVDGNGMYNLGDGGVRDIVKNDHSWRIDPIADYPASSVPPVDGLVQITFTHNTSFTDINTYPSGTPNLPRDAVLGAVVHVKNADALIGDLIQARVVDTASNRTLGLFRLPKIVGPAFDMTIPGIVETNGQYTVFVYADANGNQAYDNPVSHSGDLGWSLPGTASASGLEVTLDAQTVAEAIVDVGAP